MTVTTPSQDYLAFDAAMKARDPKWYESAPAVIGYMAWCASRDSAPPPAGGERKPAAQQEPLCMCKDRALSACPGEWEPGCDLGNNPAHAGPAGYTQAGERKPLTDEQIDRHSIAAVDCPPSSTVILVSSLRRLLGITATKGER